jgi:hypothetical protein
VTSTVAITPGLTELNVPSPSYRAVRHFSVRYLPQYLGLWHGATFIGNRRGTNARYSGEFWLVASAVAPDIDQC